MTPVHAVAERRPTRRGRPVRPPRTPQSRVAASVDVSVHTLERIAIQDAPDERAAQLLDAAEADPVHTLPFASVLERRFGQPLGWVRVRSGPRATEALDELGARAATRGDDVFLREPSAPVEVLAHEVTHALQARRGGPGPGGVVAGHAAAEVEASRVLRAPVRPAEGLAPCAIALLLARPAPAPDPVIIAPPEPSPNTELAAPAGPTEIVPTEVAQPRTEPAPTSGVEAGTAEPPGEAAPVEEALTVPSVELTVSPEDVAARAAQAAEAEAALAGAGSASDLLAAFAGAPPTVKAAQAATLAGQLGAVLPAETQEWQSAVPPLDADLSGQDGPPPEPLRVEPPPPAAVELEPGTVPPAPEPEVPDAPAAEPYTANEDVGGTLAYLTAPAPYQLAEAIGDTLGGVQVTDPSVPRSPAPPPPVQLGGETDPARIAGQEEAGSAQAGAVRDEAARAVADGPGPEQVQPTSLHESYALETVEPPASPEVVVPEGPAAYLALSLPPEVQTAFDEQQDAAMQQSMVQATTTADEATATRDAARDSAVQSAQEGADHLNQAAQGEQTDTVSAARTAIQTERRSTVDAQTAEVKRVRGEAADRRRTDEGAIDTRVQAEQKAIDDSYTAAESDIADKVAAGEQQAQAERDQAEKDAEDESWWDQAVSFVQAAFDALVSVIGDIFDAVRAAVNAALDALKTFALSVIDRLATFVKDAIAAYGAFLKLAVDALVGQIFPELAAKLTAAIDTAVSAAQAAVDVVADGLKAGISALVEGLRAGINAALDVYEAAISFAVSVVGAALTGDWGLVARKVLEAVLALVGVDPEAFYAFVGRAQETFDIIVNDPLGFLSNVVSALVGGVQGFADRFAVHLQTGLIGWLTGTLGGGGITLPPAFDLMGVLDLARQILGLTWDRIRAKAVTLIGEQNVARLEFIGGYITTLVTEGWGGLWDKIMADLGGLVEMVFDGIRSFLVERVVMAMIKKIPVLFGPAGAIVQLVMTAWSLYEFLRDQLSRIAALVTAVVDTIGDIARGTLTGAIAKVEQVLGDLVPIALDLLAKLLGLGNVSGDVRAIIEKVQAFVDKAIDALLTRVIGLFTGSGGGAGAVAPVAAPGTPESEVPTETIDEPFRIAGEDHTLRAVVVDGQATILMASGTFGAVLLQLTTLLGNLRMIYTDEGGWLHGTARGRQLEGDFTTIVDTAVALVHQVETETDPSRERIAVTQAIATLKGMFNALGLPEGMQPEHADLPPHQTRGAVDGDGRPVWFEANPLSSRSLGLGSAPAGTPPGISILQGLEKYDRGHLVAASLGGPGAIENLAPQALSTNRKWVGVRGLEDSVFRALTLTQNEPEAAPGYIFSYRTTCTYQTDAVLERELMGYPVWASTGVGQRLFALARPGNPLSEGPVIAALGQSLPPAPGTEARLFENVRRRLAESHMPVAFAIAVRILQQPEREDFQQPIAESETVKNHIGVSLEWR